MEAIVFIILQIFFAMRAIFKIGEYSRIFPILGDPGATCRDDAIDILGRKSTSRAEALTWGLGTNTLPSRYIDRKFLWAISRLLFLVAIVEELLKLSTMCKMQIAVAGATQRPNVKTIG